MKKSIKRLMAVLLCLVMCFMTSAPCFAVSLPEGLTGEQVLDAIPKTELLVENLLLQSGEYDSLEDVVYGALFSDDTLNSVFTGVYSALTENESAMKTLGIDISLSGVAAKLSYYPEVSKYLLSHESWSQALKKMNCKWNVTSKEKLKHALAAMFSPFQNLLFTLLCGGRYKVNSIVYIDGDTGYKNAIVPLLQALGCPSVLSQETFTEHAKKSLYSQVKDIADMLFATVDSILVSPVDKLCTVLPGFAYYLNNGGISKAMESLIAPLKVRIGLISVPGLDKIISQSGMLSDPSALTDMLQNMDLGGLTGSDMDLTLPEFDLKALADCCTYANGVYTTDKAAAFCEILRWAVKLLKLNKDKLLSGMGEMPPEISGYMDGLLAKSDDELIKFLFGFLSISAENSALEYSWQYPEYVPGAITYTPNLTQTEYQKVLMDVDGTLNQFMTEFAGGALSDTLSKTIYSNKVVSALAKGLYGALYTEQTSQLMSLVGLDASPKGIAKAVQGVSSSASARLSRLEKWEDMKEESFSWGFSDGSRIGFENTLIALLRPLIPFLDMLLAQGEINIFGAITLTGSNGYNTAVIPILDALGCGDIRSYAQYKQAVGTDNTLKYILDPVCDLIDSIIKQPVKTLCYNLPNLLYFVNSGGIKQCIDNLMYPITTLLQKLGMESLMPAELSQLGEFDINQVLNGLSESGVLPIKLPTPNIALVASLGQAEQMDSLRTYNGLFTPCTYIRADAPAVFLTLLRYGVNTLSLPENAEALSSFTGGSSAEKGDDPFAMYTAEMGEKFKTMTTDEIIEWLYDLLFKETPKKELPPENEEIPTIIYQPKKDYTVLIRILIVLAAVGIPTLIVLYISKTDFSAKKELRERKKLKKKRAKALKKGTPIPTSPRPGQGSARVKSTAPKPVKSEENISRQIQQMENVKPKSFHEKVEKDRALMKLKARQDKAVKKALKDAKKADKYYEQALNQSKKRK